MSGFEKSKVIIRSICEKGVERTIQEIMDFCNWQRIVPPGGKIVIKPNLCTHRTDIIHCANTSRGVIRAVCEVLLTRTHDITIGESDGLRYKAEEAFENSGIYQLARELGIKVINFSKDQLLEVDNPLLKGWRFAKTFLEADVFITLPIMKTHGITVFTGALKNQWGCIPRYDRVHLHPRLNELIVDINKLKPPQISIMDGIVGMQGRGPINGYPINLNVLLGSLDPVALDTTSMRLIGLDPFSSEHIKLAAERGLGRIREEEIEIEGDWEAFKTRVEPSRRDWAINIMEAVFHSKWLTRHLILDNRFFYPTRRVVLILRKVGEWI